jgi:adenylosuccinate lyase
MSSEPLFSPTDSRYHVPELEPYLSDDAVVKSEARVEAALAKVSARRGLTSKKIADEIELACSQVKKEEVKAEDKKIKHWSRALANVIRSKVSDEAKPWVHFPATSYDIVDTAIALRYRDATKNVILPDMVGFERTLIDLARRECNTKQIGRTHGQWAEPITFGFDIGYRLNRWGDRIIKVKESAENLRGKFSGAVGAYNASSLFFEDPESFEAEVLNEVGLKPAIISTQIAPPEPVTDFMHYITSSFGVLADYADTMRNLQRSEIAEIGEPFDEKQVGSSTMPQKRNPINFENVKSAFKEFAPRMITMYLDQISEHQRDLTNSLSQRYTAETLVMFDSSVRRMTDITRKLRVDRDNMERNFIFSKDRIIAEPLYIMLAAHGHPDAHEYVRKLTLKADAEKRFLKDVVFEDKEIEPYINKFTKNQIDALRDPVNYVGIASQKAVKVADYWETRLKDEGLLK